MLAYLKFSFLYNFSKLYYVFMKTEVLISIFIFIFFLTLYGLTCSPFAQNIADSSELITAAFTNGIAHPPGYPAYTFFLKYFIKLPFFESPTYAANFSSTLFQSLSLSLFFLSSNQLIKILKTKDSQFWLFFASFLTTLILGLSYMFWDQATIAEVFGLNNLFAGILILLILKNVEKYNVKLTLAISALFGLAAAHHQTILFLLPGFLFLFKDKIKIDKSLIKYLFGFGLGFTLPFGLLMLSNQQATFSWYFYPSFNGWWQLISRGIYSNEGSAIETFSGQIDINHSLISVFIFTKYLISHLTIPAVLLSIWGLVYIFEKNKKVAWFLTIILVISGPFLAAYLKFPLLENSSDTQYFLGTYLRLRMFLLFEYVFAFLFAVGLVSFYKKFKLKSILKYLVLLIFLAIPIYLFFNNFKTLNKSKANFDSHFSFKVLESLPSNSVLIVDSDLVFAVLYSQIVEANRPDVLIVPTTLHMRWNYMKNYLPPEIFKIKGYYELVAKLVEWGLSQEKQVLVLDPGFNFLKQVNTQNYQIYPNGYTLQISQAPKKIISYDYGLSYQLTETEISKHDLWSRGQLGNFAIMHSNLAYYYAQNGLEDGAKSHFYLAKNLVQNPRNLQYIEEIEKSILSNQHY
jgi:dolichyl-phosphate-mannose-protein mannosyltransferase